MTNSTSTEIISEGAWGNKMLTKQKHCYSTDPANKQIDENTLQPTTPCRLLIISVIINVLISTFVQTYIIGTYLRRISKHIR